MPRAQFLPATDAHVRDIAARLRQPDREEMTAAHGLNAEDAVVRLSLVRAAAASSRALVAVDGQTGQAVALLGCAPVSLVGGVAAPWLLGTDECQQYRRDLLERGRAAVWAWQQEWPVLVNHCDARHTAALRWLRRLGFTLDAPQPWGALGMPFVRFHRCA